MYAPQETCGVVLKVKLSLSVLGFAFLFLPSALRHTYTSNLLSGGAKPKVVQELLGHSDVSTRINIYAHSTRKEKRTSAKLLDKVPVRKAVKSFLREIIRKCKV